MHHLLPFLTISDDVPVDALLSGLAQHANVAYGIATTPVGGTYGLLVIGDNVPSERTFLFSEKTQQVELLSASSMQEGLIVSAMDTERMQKKTYEQIWNVWMNEAGTVHVVDPDCAHINYLSHVGGILIKRLCQSNVPCNIIPSDHRLQAIHTAHQELLVNHHLLLRQHRAGQARAQEWLNALEQTQQSNRILEQSNETLKQHITVLEQSNDRQGTSIDEVTKKWQQLQEAHETLKQQYHTVNNTNRMLNHDLQKQKEQALTAENTVKRLTAQLAECNRAMESAKDEAEQWRTKYRNHEDVNAINEALQKDKAALDKELTELKQKTRSWMEETKKQLKETEKTNQALQKEMEETKTNGTTITMDLNKSPVVKRLVTLCTTYFGTTHINEESLKRILDQSNRFLKQWGDEKLKLTCFKDISTAVLRMTLRWKTLVKEKKSFEKGVPVIRLFDKFEVQEQRMWKPVHTFRSNGVQRIDRSDPGKSLKPIVQYILDRQNEKNEFLVDNWQHLFSISSSELMAEVVRSAEFHLEEYGPDSPRTVREMAEEVMHDVYLEFDFHRPIVMIRKGELIDHAIMEKAKMISAFNIFNGKEEIIAQSMKEACDRRMHEILVLTTEQVKWEDAFVGGIPVHKGTPNEVRAIVENVEMEEVAKKSLLMDEHGFDPVSAQHLLYKSTSKKN